MAQTLRVLGALTLLLGPLPAQTLPSVLSLEKAIETALSRHGEVEAAQAAVDASQGALRQAGYAPNPTFHFQTENWRFTGTPGFSPGQELDVFAFVSQPIETGGKKGQRVEFAAADRRIAEAQREVVRWKIRQDVKSAYLRVEAAQRKESLLRETRATFERLREYHETRVRLGAMPEVSLIKVELETEKVEMALSSAQLETERAKIDLLRAMGASDASPQFAIQETRATMPAAPWENPSFTGNLLEAAAASRPDVLLAEALVERARAAIGVQRAATRPDLTPYVGYKRTASYNTLIGGVSIPLPIRNRNTGAIEQAVAEVHQQEASLRATRARVQAEVAAALAGVRRRARMLTAVETRLMQRAQTTSQITLAAYQEGGIELLDVLDAQRSQIETGLLQSQILYDYQLSRIELEAAVGTDSVLFSGAGERAAN
jgi:cobalt-zinc-cadmium efflux system outer membrane protein